MLDIIKIPYLYYDSTNKKISLDPSFQNTVTNLFLKYKYFSVSSGAYPLLYENSFLIPGITFLNKNAPAHISLTVPTIESSYSLFWITPAANITITSYSQNKTFFYIYNSNNPQELPQTAPPSQLINFVSNSQSAAINVFGFLQYSTFRFQLQYIAAAGSLLYFSYQPFTFNESTKNFSKYVTTVPILGAHNVPAANERLVLINSSDQQTQQISPFLITNSERVEKYSAPSFFLNYMTGSFTAFELLV